MKQTLKYILEKLIQMRKFAEEKHSITIALSSGVIVFSSYFISSQRQEILLVSAASIVFALISVLCSFLALAARRVRIKSFNKKESGDLIDFRSVSKFGVNDYLETVKTLYNFPKTYKFDQFDKDLATQIISTAKVISIKFSYFNSAILFLALSVICAVISICFYAGF